ncbi:hypothetical protein [Halopiger djelfimassiliensis]|uniref:hypothetical protein n=1 Tax=Halopiger djelfimassiliensis TaxID=1293047 RepID=UPI000677CC9B|nr:hypothetical protein [Halopiger djelfimassiliensis]
MPTRRTLLRKGGLTGFGTVAGIAALPSPPDAAMGEGTVEGAKAPAAVAPWTDGAITDEGEAPIARYHYRVDPKADGIDGVAATAPINVVFVTEDGLERVMAVLEDAGWLRDIEEYTRYAWDREAEEYVRQQATAAETYYGANGRYHVRCWSFEGLVSMQAHEDTSVRPKHGIASYERGRRAIERLYAAAGWSVSPGVIDLQNEKEPDHDGLATVITEPR